jgi:DNA-binding IclR family transcriptional regulator
MNIGAKLVHRARETRQRSTSLKVGTSRLGQSCLAAPIDAEDAGVEVAASSRGGIGALEKPAVERGG